MKKNKISQRNITRLLLQSLISPDAAQSFDTFVSGYAEIFDNFSFHLMQKIDTNSQAKVGFLDDPYRFYATSSNGLSFYSLNENNIECFQSFKIPNKIEFICQHPSNPFLFALSTKSTVHVYNFKTDTNVKFSFTNQITEISWLSDTNTLILIRGNREIDTIDINQQLLNKAVLTNNEHKDVNNILFCSHPTRPCVASIMNSKLQLIDFRESPTVQTKIIKGAPTSIAWLPNDTFGCAIGHDDGNVDLFSFQSNSVVITQNVSENAISGISFCETRNNVASFTSDNLILFSTLPVWGFGKFSVSKTYPMHTSNVTSANWFPRSDGNPMFISCDMDSMVHIFEVPNEYIPIYGT